MTTILGFIVLCLAWAATHLLAVPLYIGLFMAVAVPLALFCAVVVVIVALLCRGTDKIRGGI